MRKIYKTLLWVVIILPLTGICQSIDFNNDGIVDTGDGVIPIENHLPKDTGDVVHTIPIPSRYCWALAWDGEALWSADYITKKFIKLDPQTGNELQSFSYPTVVKYIEGLAWDGEYLWATGWYESNGNGSHIFKIDPETGEKLKDYFYPSDDPWPHGLAYDGEYLWSANYIYEGISTMDKISTTGNLITSYDIPENDYYGLTWDGNSLWVDDMDYHMLYEMRYPAGIVELEVNSPCGNPRDMAWDGEYLWVLSWETETIYQINVGPAEIPNNSGFSFYIYPNPADNTTVINLNPQYTGIINIRLINIVGNVIYKKSIQTIAGQNLSLPLKDLCNVESLSGLFLLEIETIQQTMVRKIIF